MLANRRLRPVDLLLTAAARWLCARDRGIAELQRRVERAYREAAQLEAVEGETLENEIGRRRARKVPELPGKHAPLSDYEPELAATKLLLRASAARRRQR
jgi:hypothetical protein